MNSKISFISDDTNRPVTSHNSISAMRFTYSVCTTTPEWTAFSHRDY